jgi:hypothetical protein
VPSLIERLQRRTARRSPDDSLSPRALNEEVVVAIAVPIADRRNHVAMVHTQLPSPVLPKVFPDAIFC